MARFGAIPDIGKNIAGERAFGMPPLGANQSLSASQIGANLAPSMAQPINTQGLSGKGFGTSLPRSFALGMQKGMQVGQQAALEQARMVQIRQAELREKIKQAEVVADQGIQQIRQIVANAPNRSPVLAKAVEPIVAQVSDLARIMGQFDQDAAMRVASNLRLAVTTTKTLSEVHTEKALGKQQQPQGGPGQGAQTPPPAVPPPLSGAAAAAGALPPGGSVPVTPGMNGAPAASPAPVGATPAAYVRPSAPIAPQGMVQPAAGSTSGVDMLQNAQAIPPVPGPAQAQTPPAAAAPQVQTPAVQAPGAAPTQQQKQKDKQGLPSSIYPPQPESSASPTGGLVKTSKGKGKGGGGEGEGLGQQSGKIAIIVEGLKMLQEKNIVDPDTKEKISGYDILAHPSKWDAWMIAQDAMPWLPEGKVGNEHSVALVKAKNMMDTAVEGLFRSLTGAQFNRSELPRLQRMFVPYWGNDDSVAQQKLNGLYRVTERILRYGLKREMTMEEAEVFAKAYQTVVTNDDEYNALAPGTVFTDADGNQFKKPEARQPDGAANAVAR